MIIDRSVLLSEQVSIEVEKLEKDYQFARGNVFVEAFRDGKVSGFSFYDRRSLKRCHVYADPETGAPSVIYGLATAFDKVTLTPSDRADAISFSKDDPKLVANFILRYFTDNVS